MTSGELNTSKYLSLAVMRAFPPSRGDVTLSAEPIARQQFDSGMVTLAVALYFDGTFRLRACSRVLSIFATSFRWIPGMERVPCYTTVRMWLLRIGLYKLQNAKTGSRWAMLCDHTATFGGMKLLVICGVDLDMLENRLENKSGDFNLTHKDVQPLSIIPMKNSNGEVLLGHYLECFEKHGTPEDMISDGGSDIIKSARLLAEHQNSQGQEVCTRHIYDLSHRIARIIQAELEPSERWQNFEGFIMEARRYCKYKAKQLSPPSLRHGPDRWMNLNGNLKWYEGMVESLKSEVEPVARDRFGLTERILETGRATYRKLGKVFTKLSKICGKEHPSEEAYEKSLLELAPDMPEGMKEFLNERKDLNQSYRNETMEGWEQHQDIHREVANLLVVTNEIQKKLKKEGLSKETVMECKQIYEEGNLEGLGESAGRKVIEMIVEMEKDLPPGKRLLATSDVVESLNGKWKTLIEGSRTPALGSNALLMAALMGDMQEDEVKRALEAIKVEEVEAWTEETIGTTFHREKLARARVILPENPQELILGF